MAGKKDIIADLQRVTLLLGLAVNLKFFSKLARGLGFYGYTKWPIESVDAHGN